MNLHNWQHIRKVVADAQRAAMHCSIATVDQHLQPTITPIGTLFLHEQGYSGFFFDAKPGGKRQSLHSSRKQ